MSRSNQRAAPVQFISIDAATDKFRVNDQAISILKKITGPVAVVSICGRARQGKSFLLNQIVKKLRNQQDNELAGFAVSGSARTCTKGLWLWSEPIALPGVGPDGRKCHVVLMDCEGIDATDQNAEYSTQIFSLAVLLSSLFVYNQLGGIDELALDRLCLVSELSRQIYEKASTEGGSSDAKDFAPSFLWVLRDYILEMDTEDGQALTPKEYLEGLLKPLENTKKNENKNQVRNSIRSLFPERDLATLVRPIDDERKLRKMEGIPLSEMKDSFREGLSALVDKIIRQAKPKRCLGVVANGAALAGLCKAFVHAINEGAVPTLNNAWAGVMRDQCLDAMEEATAHFRKVFKSDLPADEAAFTAELARALAEASDVFRKRAAMANSDVQEPFLKKLQQVAEQHVETEKTRRFQMADNIVTELLSAARVNFMTLLHTVDPQQPQQLASLAAQLKEFVTHYQATASGPTMYPRLLQLLHADILPGLHKLTADTAAKAAHLAQEVKAKSDALAGLEQKTRDLDVQLQLSNQRHNASEKEIESLKAEQSRLQTELGHLRQEKSELQGQLARAHAESQVFVQQVQVSKTACEDLTKEVHKLQQELMAAKVTISQVTMERDNLANFRAKATAEMEASASDVSSLTQKLSRKESELEAARAKQQDLQENLSRQERAAAESAERLDSVRKELDELRAQYQQTVSSANKSQAGLTHLEQQLGALNQKEREARLQAESMKKQYEAVAEKEREARQLAISLQGQVRQIEEERAGVREELQAAQALVESLREQMQAQDGDFGEMRAQLRQQLESSTQSLQEALEAQQQVQGDLASTQETLKQALVEKSGLLAELSAQQSKLDEVSEELASRKMAADRVAAELATARSEVAMAQAELAPQLAQANARVTSLQQQLEEAEARMLSIQSEKSRLQSQVEQHANLELKISALEESLVKVTAERDDALARQRELRNQLALQKHVGRMSNTTSPAPSAAFAAAASVGRMSIDASGHKPSTDPATNPSFTIGASPKPTAGTSARATPVRRPAPAAKATGYSSPVITMFANFNRSDAANDAAKGGAANTDGTGFVFTAGVTSADTAAATPVKEEDGGVNATPVPIANMSPVEEHVTPKAEMASAGKVPGGAVVQGTGEEDDSPSAPPVPEPAESLSMGARTGREKRKREEDMSYVSPDLQRQAKRAGRHTPSVMGGVEGTPTSAVSKEPSSPYGTPVTNPEGMTITEIKEWLTLNGHEDATWELAGKKPKKADWVRLIKQKAGLA